MDTGKSHATARRNVKTGIRRTDFACIYIRPALQTHFVVEKQITARFPLAYQQCGVTSHMAGVKAAQINITQDVDIMKQYRNICSSEKGDSLFQAPACIQQLSRFIRNVDVNTVIALLQMANELLGKMMDVDNDVLHTERLHSFKHNVDQRTACNGYKRLGHYVRQRT